MKKLFLLALALFDSVYSFALPVIVSSTVTNYNFSQGGIAFVFNASSSASGGFTNLVQYGLTTNYDSVSPSSTLIAPTNALLTNNVIGLSILNTVYHYRIVSSDSTGTTNGPDFVFTNNAVGIVSYPAMINYVLGQIGGITNTNAGSKIFANSPLFVVTNGITNVIGFTNSSPIALTNVANSFVGNGAGLTNASRNLGVIEFISPVGGGNGIYDVLTAPAGGYEGELGISYYSPAGGANGNEWITSYDGGGVGTNGWGKHSFNFPTGINLIGNVAWNDGALPVTLNQTSSGLGTVIYQQYGSNASSYKRAFVGGNTNSLNNLIQSGIGLVIGNPWTGSGQISSSVAFSNFIHGVDQGINADGMHVYIPQFGDSFGQIGDAYPVGEQNQAPCSLIQLHNDPYLVSYISINGVRPGDSQIKQFPAFAIDWGGLNGSSQIANINAGFPFQVANVEVTSNANWKWALEVNESTGMVTATNNVTTLAAIRTMAHQPVTIGYNENGDTLGHDVDINGSVIVWGNPTNSVLGIGSPSFSCGLGLTATPGLFPNIAGAATVPIKFGHYAVSDLMALGLSSANFTEQVDINPNGDVLMTNSLSVSNLITTKHEQILDVGASKVMITDSAGHTTNAILSGLSLSGTTLSVTGGGSGSQTPWTNNQNAAGFNLSGVSNISTDSETISNIAIFTNGNAAFTNTSGVTFDNITVTNATTVGTLFDNNLAIKSVIYSDSGSQLQAQSGGSAGQVLTYTGINPSHMSWSNAPAATGNTTSGIATAGTVGEWSSAGSAGAIALTNNVITVVASQSMTAGRWMVSGTVTFVYSTATFGQSAIAVNTSPSFPSGGLGTFGTCYNNNVGTLISSANTLEILPTYLSSSSAFTNYLCVSNNFTAGSVTATATLQYIRVN